MGFQSYESPNFEKFQDSQIWESQDKITFGCRPRAKHREYYKGGRWWLPLSPNRGESCESMYARGSSV